MHEDWKERIESIAIHWYISHVIHISSASSLVLSQPWPTLCTAQTSTYKSNQGCFLLNWDVLSIPSFYLSPAVFAQFLWCPWLGPTTHHRQSVHRSSDWHWAVTSHHHITPPGGAGGWLSQLFCSDLDPVRDLSESWQSCFSHSFEIKANVEFTHLQIILHSEISLWTRFHNLSTQL